MRNTFTSDSPFFHKLSTFSDLVFLNLLTILCSLPIFTMGAAVTALYYTVDRMRQGESGLYRGYFRSFKENFKQATILWLILLVVGGAICLCILVYYQMNEPFLMACSILALLIWGIVVSWLFPMLAKFYSTTFGALRNAVLCGTTYLPLSIAMTVVNLIPLALLLFVPGIFIQLGCLWLFIWFSLAAWCNTGLLKTPFSALLPAEDKAQEAENT